MSVELETIKSGYSTGLINANFQEIANLLNNNYLQRDGVTFGDPNHMEVDLDMNGNAILNAATTDDPSSLATKEYVDAQDEEAVDEANAYTDEERADREAAIAAEAAARAAGDEYLADLYNGLVAPIEAEHPIISWHAQEIGVSATIPANKNAWSFGPVLSIADGQIITVEQGSYWTIANGLDTESLTELLEDLSEQAQAIQDYIDTLGVVEEQTLSVGQTVVTLVSATTPNMALYVEGVREFDFTIDSNNQFTLGTTYPDGTKIWITK